MGKTGKNKKTVGKTEKKTEKLSENNFGVEKSKFASRLKRALPKFRDDRSEVWGVNGRSKFVCRRRRPSENLVVPLLRTSVTMTLEGASPPRA